MSGERKRSLSPRLQGLIVALFFGWFLTVIGCDWWSEYWLMKDGQQGMAVVTRELWTGHNAVDYRYTVNQKQYTGKSGRNYRIPQYSHVVAGEPSIVYYSAFHPWLSSLRMPTVLGQGWPVILIVLCFEFFAVVTIINPKSGWAFNFSGKSKLPARTTQDGTPPGGAS